ncbi:MAG: alanine--tRNA ligase [Elusimicrobia bacterium]|nr:alanine--tRNA ligase [Candidatus Obscuribacterium magneticum]
MKDLRQAFLQFFKKQNHTLVPSDSLIPSSDPTLLFTSAGMVQFKAHFLQQIPLTFRRAASSQRCLRTTDIDVVGTTPRHLTFFEMLGNFSFGDYFKEEAIAWGWEFLTKDLNIPKERLWATVYKEDDEAHAIWKKLVPESRISRLGEDTNFWNMGPTGPCGPCSEIHWDFGSGPTKGPDDSDRWMEVWNLVFTQFDRQADGRLTPLPNKNIDTGMGLERLTSVVEGVSGAFETSLLKPLIKFGEEMLEHKYGKDSKKDVSLRIVADHLRAVTLLVFDGILPSNEGRGYVLRRLLRRAVRQGTLFGKKEPFLYRGVSIVTDYLKDAALGLVERRESIALLIKQEEERFLETVETGLGRLNELVDAAKKAKKKRVPGKDVFRLYDTYGFPPELTKEILEESSMTFDEKEFGGAREGAQRLAREGWKGSGAKDVAVYNEILKKIGPSTFRGYETLSLKTQIRALIKDGQSVPSLKAGEKGEVIVSETPFYPEGGGQVGDKGGIHSTGGDVAASVLNTHKPINDLISHTVTVLSLPPDGGRPGGGAPPLTPPLAGRGTENLGGLSVGDTIELRVDKNHREPTMRHHTATHLLHAALRKVLGPQATQAGSLVSPEKLRFDYSYNKALAPEQIKEIETIVNEAVLKNMKATPILTTPEAARKMGAMALFGEKYGDKVRCLVISEHEPDAPEKAFSLELCGGTHCSRTGDIGAFKILSETSIAAGARRIEAVSGLKALEHFNKREEALQALSEKLKATPQELGGRIDKMLERQKQLEQEVRDLKIKLAQGGSGSPGAGGPEIQTVNGIPLAIKVAEGLSVDELRTLADRLKHELKSGVVFVATTTPEDGREKVSFVFAVTPDLKEKGLNAGQLAKAVAQELGGSGGGRADFAQGGGQGKENLQSILKKIPSLIK